MCEFIVAGSPGNLEPSSGLLQPLGGETTNLSFLQLKFFQQNWPDENPIESAFALIPEQNMEGNTCIEAWESHPLVQRFKAMGCVLTYTLICSGGSRLIRIRIFQIPTSFERWMKEWSFFSYLSCVFCLRNSNSVNPKQCYSEEDGKIIVIVIRVTIWLPFLCLSRKGKIKMGC